MADMTDIQRELNDVKEKVDQVVAAEAAPVAPAAPDKVYLRQPNTGKVVEVNAVPAELIPYMLQGYQQYQPATPAKE